MSQQSRRMSEREFDRFLAEKSAEHKAASMERLASISHEIEKREGTKVVNLVASEKYLDILVGWLRNPTIRQNTRLMSGIRDSIKQYEEARGARREYTTDEYLEEDYERFVADIIRLAKIRIRRENMERMYLGETVAGMNEALGKVYLFITKYEEVRERIRLLDSVIDELHQEEAAIRDGISLSDNMDLSVIEARIAALRES